MNNGRNWKVQALKWTKPTLVNCPIGYKLMMEKKKRKKKKRRRSNLSILLNHLIFKDVTNSTSFQQVCNKKDKKQTSGYLAKLSRRASTVNINSSKVKSFTILSIFLAAYLMELLLSTRGPRN